MADDNHMEQKIPEKQDPRLTYSRNKSNGASVN